ncbi:MAG: type II toxin-antitoxin system HicB family antitoxin [Candidatus Neomarinimicrobiota bacterium]
MKKNHMIYKGYYSTVDFSPDDECLYGKILGVADSISFHSNTAADIQKAFKEAVNDYLDTCEKNGKKPLKSVRGSFNVRVKPETHLKTIIKAQAEGVSLNKIVNRAIEKEVAEVIIPS